MSNNRRTQWDTPTNDPGIVVQTTVWHCKDTKAYWCAVTPVELDGMFRTTVCYSGVKQNLGTVPRFNVRKLDDLAHSVKNSEHWKGIQSAIADTKGLTLV